MKNIKSITEKIQNDKELIKRINSEKYSNVDDFINNANRYLKAIKDGRMCCIIDSVSSSGMSRKLKFLECNGSKKTGYRYYNFYLLFSLLGFASVKNSDSFQIYGCGMDMVFDTNYRIIRKLHSLGFINKTQCNELCQKTPTVL